MKKLCLVIMTCALLLAACSNNKRSQGESHRYEAIKIGELGIWILDTTTGNVKCYMYNNYTDHYYEVPIEKVKK